MSKTLRNFTLLLGALLFVMTAPAFADRAPDWMVGTFEGYNAKYRQNITIRMNNEGIPIVTNVKDGQRIARTTASFNRGLLTIDSRDYRVEQTRDGFRMTQSDDRQNLVEFKRIGDYDSNWQNDRNDRNDRGNGTGRDTRPPDWMVGTYEGYNRKYRQTITVRMNNQGNPIVTNVKDGQRIARNTATFRRGYLTIDKKDYRIEQTNDGFRMTQSDDRQNRVEFKRIGDYDSNWQNDRSDRNDRGNGTGRDTRPPDWMVGRFEGYDGQSRRNLFIRMNSDGNLIVSNQRNGERTNRSTASYRRSLLTIDDREYRIEPVNDGFRLIQSDNRQTPIVFRRTGDY